MKRQMDDLLRKTIHSASYYDLFSLFNRINFLLSLIVCFPFLLHGSVPDSILKMLDPFSGKERIERIISLTEETFGETPELALILAFEAEQLARQGNHIALQSDALKFKADALFYLDSLHASVQAYIMSAQVEQSAKYPRLDSILRRLGDAGYVYYQLGWFEKAVEYHSRALEMSEQLQDTVEIATNLSNLGINYKMLGQYGKAIDCFLRTLEIDELTGNDADMSVNYNSIGMVYLAWGNYEQALEFLEMALEKDISRGEIEKQSIRLSNISQVYMAMKKPEKAIEYLERALDIDQKSKSKSKIATRLQGLGLAYVALEQYEKSLAYYNDAFLIFNNLNMGHKIADLYSDYGDLYLAMGKLAEAEQNYLQAFEISLANNSRPLMMESASGLYQIHKANDNSAEALYYYEVFKAIEDSIFSEQSAILLHEFEVKYELEKKAMENQLLLADNKLRKRNQQFFLITIIVLIFLSLSLLWALILKRNSLTQSRQLNSKEKELSDLKIRAFEAQNVHLREMLFAEEEIKKLQDKNLERQKQELTSATMLIANKNEVFEKLRILAEQIKENGSPDRLSEAKEIVAEIDRQTDLNDQWEQFKIHFESIHRSFFENLRNINGCLTQNDLQLCAYIKLNLSTKEISRLMNITPESVNTHRYRLRKKFKLPAQQTLDDLLHGF
jgi:tetratricopeptide (TPR) repeat protein